MKQRLLNVSLRLIVMISRFFFLLFIAKFLNTKDVGLYGLLVATVGYTLYFLGLDFYTYTTREIAASSRENWGWYLKSQSIFSLLIYSAIIPSTFFLFYFDALPIELAKWFIIILILEHICLELIRFFIAASEQVSSTIVLFLNQAAWAIAIIIIMLVYSKFRNLNTILFAWSIGSSLAVIYGFLKIIKMNVGGWSYKVSWEWIFTGVKVAVPLLIATLAYRGVFTIDRYILDVISNLEVVASYILFIGIAGALLAFLDAAVFSFSYPKMIIAYKRKDLKEFKLQVKNMILFTSLSSLLFTITSSITLPYLISWIGKQSYLQYYDIYYWALTTMTINAFWMIFHYALYAQGLDKHIIYSHLLSFLLFITSTFIMQPAFGIKSVLIGLCLSQLLILIWKFFFYIKSISKNF